MPLVINVFGFVGMVIGFITVATGIFRLLKRSPSRRSWRVQILGWEVENAETGVVLVVVGAVVFILTGQLIQ